MFEGDGYALDLLFRSAVLLIRPYNICCCYDFPYPNILNILNILAAPPLTLSFFPYSPTGRAYQWVCARVLLMTKMC